MQTNEWPIEVNRRILEELNFLLVFISHAFMGINVVKKRNNYYEFQDGAR